MTYRLYGPLDRPEDWQVLEPGHTISGSLAIQVPNFFVREFTSYRECRKWVLAELKTRRDALGKTMDKWFKVSPDRYDHPPNQQQEFHA
jgi:hypothetical protein